MARTREAAWRGWKRMPLLRRMGHTAESAFTVVRRVLSAAMFLVLQGVRRIEVSI